MSKVHTCDVCGFIHHADHEDETGVVICPDCSAWAASMGVE